MHLSLVKLYEPPRLAQYRDFVDFALLSAPLRDFERQELAIAKDLDRSTIAHSSHRSLSSLLQLHVRGGEIRHTLTGGTFQRRDSGVA